MSANSVVNYGETQAKYCDNYDNSCNGGTDDGILDGNETSEAYTARNSFSLASKSWRVLTKDELKLLIECIDQTMPNDLFSNCGAGNYTSPTVNDLFPNTVSNYYWSSSGKSSEPNSAWNIFFFLGTAGSATKHTPYYVRCVSE